MTAGTLALAIVSSIVFLGSGTVVAVTVTRACFPDWHGSLGFTAASTIGIAWALALGQLLGAFGGLNRPLLLAASLVSAAACAGWVVWSTARAPAPTGGAEPDPPPPPPPAPVPERSALDVLLLAATALEVLVVAAIWTMRTVITVRRGLLDPDTLGYHLPFATVFAQTGYADTHRFVFPLFPLHFYPANDELLSGIALVLTRSVVFVAIKNLLFGGLILSAAHALGARFGAGRLALAGAALALAAPTLAFSQPGEGVNDTLMLLALVAGLAFLAHAGRRPAPYVLTAACVGIAAGVKFSSIVPAILLGVIALALLWSRAPGRRLVTIAAGAAAAFATGGSWYLRNAITFGNPIPPARIKLGPVHLRQIVTYEGTISFAVARYLVRRTFLDVIWDGVRRALGPLAIVLIVVVVAGVIASALDRDGLRRGLGVFSVGAVLAYLVTPAGAYGRGGPSLVSISINFHYAAPAVLVGLIAAGIAVGRARWGIVLPLVGVAVATTGFGSGRKLAFWAPEMGGSGLPVLLAAAAIGTAAVVLVRLVPTRRAVAGAGTAVAVVVAVVGAAVVAHQYDTRDRTDPIVEWAKTLKGVSVAAFVPNIADLYGPEAANRVGVPVRLANGEPLPVDTCTAWKEDLIRGGYEYVVVIPNTAWQRWQNHDPAFRPIGVQTAAAIVYRIVGQPDARCLGEVNTDALKFGRG